MVDLFAEAVAKQAAERRESDLANGIGIDEQSTTSVGGHSLRRRNEKGRTARPTSNLLDRPRSVFSPSRGLAEETQRNLTFDTALATIPQQHQESDDSDNNDQAVGGGRDDDEPSDDDEDDIEEIQDEHNPNPTQPPQPPPSSPAPTPPSTVFPCGRFCCTIPASRTFFTP